MKNSKTWIFFLSLFVTIAIAFVPIIGNRKEDEAHIFGFPADMIAFYGDRGFSFQSLGPFFNLAFFYVIFLLLYKMVMKSKKVKA